MRPSAIYASAALAALSILFLLIRSTIRREIRTMDANTANAIANVKDQVTKLQTVEAGLGTLIDSVGAAIKDKIDQAIANANSAGNADVVAALTALGSDVGGAVDGFSAAKDKLSAAIMTNTPAATDGTAPAAATPSSAPTT